MRVELLLQISMATLTALGTLLLGLGEREVTLPLLAMIVSASSVYLTDVSGWLRLNPKVANIAGSTAVVVFVWDFLQRFETETQLLAVANLLIYLQFVLLYQRKTDSTYWLLALLSLLQVAVATALSFELIFGILLLAYVVCGLGTLGLFLLYREGQRCEQPARASISTGETTEPPRRWPLETTGSTIRTAWQSPAVTEPVGWRFIRQVLGLSASTVFCALAVFFVVPRIGETRWRAPIGTVQNTIGAANEVTLDEIGPILDNPEVVMQVQLYEGDTDRPYQIREAPLFRGPCLTSYAKKKWTKATPPTTPPPVAEMNGSAKGLVREVIRLKPLVTDSVYCVVPVKGMRSASDDFTLDQSTQLISRRNPEREQTLQLYTSGFSNGRQVTILKEFEDHRHRDLLSLDERELPELITLANALAGDISDTITRARALTNHLHDSGLYRYSLTAPRRNPKIDPIEDFLSEHREGHCEYFASALTLMLRAVKIPSRMVLGFNGGEWNPIGQFIQVRQLHAHAWVEAYLTREQLPENLRGKYPYGGWLTLDPTPGTSGALSRVGPTPGLPNFRQMVDYARYVWSSYIMAMDYDRQLRMIYLPVFAAFVSFVQLVTTMTLSGWLMLFGLIAAVIVLSASVLVRSGNWFNHVARRLPAFMRPPSRSRAAPVPLIKFYRQLETILARIGLVRTDHLTQQEFAALAQSELAARGYSPRLARVPLDVAAAFYAVRFGNRQLDKTQLEAVEQALAMLHSASTGPQPPR